MKKYETPQLNEVRVQVEDVIATSAGFADGNNENPGDFPVPGGGF